MKQTNSELLSRQEKKVMVALSQGSLYKEIAAEFFISINTVKKHIKNIYRKLEVKKRREAIEKYQRITSGEGIHSPQLA